MRSREPVSLAHVLPLGTAINEAGHLEVGGCDLLEVAAAHGTPVYVVAEEDLRTRARVFRDGLRARHPDGEVLFASKAFPCTAILRILAEEGLGCDVASGGELALALRAGFDPDRILLHGNAKSLDELRFALRSGVGHVVLDSVDDVDRLEGVCAEAETETGRGDGGEPQPVLLRITPDVSGDTHAAISTGQADSKFGFGLGEAHAAIERVRTSPHLRFAGLHCHIGSQLLSLEPFRVAVAALAQLGDPPVINLGGGLGVAYREEDAAPSMEDYLDALTGAVHAELGPAVRLLLEPGRALVANSTVTLYTVQTVKRNVSTWVAVDGGMSDNLRPMLYGAPYAALMAARPQASGGERCHLAGKHCESGDVIARDVVLDDPRPGEVVVTPVTGAYGYALANNYNGVTRPPVVLCSGGEARVVVRRETYEDLMARDASR